MIEKEARRGGLLQARTRDFKTVIVPGETAMIGSYATVMGLAAAGGQLAGGLLLRADVAGLGWRAVFLVNVPVGAGILALLRRAVPESRAADPGRFDAAACLRSPCGGARDGFNTARRGTR